MSSLKEQALQYVKNTNGGATKENFIEDFAPVGQMLWDDLKGIICIDSNGHIFLTSAKEQNP
jgi:hypothetical protein